jgi:uncharacterized protein (TIGR03382 family)
MNRLGIAALVALSAGSTAFAGGIVRDPNLSSTNAAFSVGNLMFSWSNAQLSTANPSNTTIPFSAAIGSGDAAFFTDVDANPTGSGNYKSALVGGTTTTSQLSKFTWVLGGNLAAAGGNRAVLGSFGTFGSQSYSGNTALANWTNVGTGSWRADISVETGVVRVGAGQAYGYSKLKATRIAVPGGSNNSQPIILSFGSLTDLDIGSNGGTGDSLSNISGSGEFRIRSTDGSNFGQAVGIGADSFRGHTRSNVGGALTSGGASNLGNTLNTAGDNSVGFTWNRTLAAVGDSVTVETWFSINTTALPTPGAAALAGLGLLVAGRRRRA